MLLYLLNKEEKHRFIDLLITVISADGPTSETEKKIVEIVKYEMGEDAIKYRNSNMPLEKLIEYFTNKSKAIKNVVYYNISWATLSDEFYSVEEHLILEEIQREFGITNRKKTELLKAVYAERDLKEKIKRFARTW